MPPDNIFDRQFFGDLSQFDTTSTFFRTIIEPTITIDSIIGALIKVIGIVFTTRVKQDLSFITRIKQSLSSTTRIKDVEDKTI